METRLTENASGVTQTAAHVRTAPHRKCVRVAMTTVT